MRNRRLPTRTAGGQKGGIADVVVLEPDHARGNQRYPAKSVSFNGEGDLRVDPITGDPVILDLGLEFLDIDRGNATHRRGGFLDSRLRRLLPAIRGLGKDLDHLDQSHDDSS